MSEHAKKCAQELRAVRDFMAGQKMATIEQSEKFALQVYQRKIIDVIEWLETLEGPQFEKGGSDG